MFYREVWTSLDKFGQVWTSLDKFGQIWTHLYQFGQVWTSLYTFRPAETFSDYVEANDHFCLWFQYSDRKSVC